MIDDYPKLVELRDRRNATLRIATREDEERLVRFFELIPENERNFLRYDVTDGEALDGWFGGPNWEDVFPLVAEVNNRIVGVGILQSYRTPWVSHVGEFWMVVAQNVRSSGLGRILANEMFGLAAELGMEKVGAEVRADYPAALKIFTQMGFLHEGVLTDYIKDQSGQTHDLIIMACNIKDYFQRLEAFGKKAVETRPTTATPHANPPL